MLASYFNKIFYSYGGLDQSPLPSTTLCACLRLGHKYQFNALVFEALKRLQLYFPITLNEMDTIPQKAAIELDRPADFFDLANILKEMQCYPLLPMALLRCVSGSDVFSTIAVGAPRRDGTWSVLSRENLLVCIPAWRSLFQELFERSRRWRDLVDPNCTGNSTCRQQVALFAEDSLEDMVELRTLFRPWHADWEDHMCIGCVESWKARFNLARRDSFSTLPCHFGLSGWDALTSITTVRLSHLNPRV